MRVFKNVNGLEVYKFGVISPVLHGSERHQNEYFRRLFSEGIRIPPGSDNIYYLKPSTFKRWLREFRLKGLEGLKETPRCDKGKFRKIPSQLFEFIKKIKEEMGAISVSDLYRKLLIKNYIRRDQVSYETLRVVVKRHRLLLDKKALKQRKKFEKEFINELWMVDFKQGKSIKQGRRMVRTYLCAIIDDASRLLVGHEWGLNEDTVLFARTLKRAISVYGIPKILYCDQGKVFLSHYIMQICARLGISLINAAPYSPESKAKIERFNRTVGQMFYPMVKDFSTLDIDRLNRLFEEFIHDIYHQKDHASLGEPPLRKFQSHLNKTPIRRITNEQLEQFFLCSIKRKGLLDGTIRIKNIYYEVDMKYAGEFVDIRFAVDNPDRLFLFENDKQIRQLKPVDLVGNANPPFVSTSYSKLLQK
jgi:putative transposase